MKLSRFGLLISGVASLANASPIFDPRAETDSSLEPRQYNRLEDVAKLRKEFRGINWNKAADDQECSLEQFIKLSHATRMAHEMAWYKTDFEYKTNAWNRYFMAPGMRSDWQASEQNEIVYETIRNNIVQVKEGPVLGSKDRDGKYSYKTQVTYRCKVPDYVKGCSKSPGSDGRWHGKVAVTAVPSKTYDDEGWSIVFCPRFFEDVTIGNIDELTAQGPVPHWEIETLMSTSHIVAHEWMHVDLFGFRQHITDLNAVFSDHPAAKPVYGSDLSYQFAWINQPEINKNVLRNADNYAWFFTYNWFDQHWGTWETDGNFTLHDHHRRGLDSREDDEDESDLEDTVSVDDIDIDTDEPPINVFFVSRFDENVNYEDFSDEDGNPLVEIDYVGMPYEDLIEEMYDGDREGFYARNSDCMLSAGCYPSPNLGTNEACFCTCDDEEVELEDPRCEGFAGGPGTLYEFETRVGEYLGPL